MLVLKQRWQCCAERTVKETLMNYGFVQKGKKNLFVCLLYGCSVSVLVVVKRTEVVPSD